MKSLLIRERHMQHLFIDYIVLACGVIGYVINDSFETYNSVVFIVLTFAPSHSLILRFYLEDKNKHSSFFTAMPYSRAQIVASMYICYVFPMYILSFLSAIIFTLFDIPTQGVGMVSIIICVQINLILLTFYATYGKKSIWYSYITEFVSAIFMIALNVVYRYKLKSTFIFNEGLPLLFIILLMFGVSTFLLSVHFFKKRDI